MNIPALVLLGCAAWTLLTLFGSIGVYRWSRILTGRASIAEWQADTPQGSDWYRRAMRAHMNCVENLPIYGAVVLALTVTGLQSDLIEWLSIAMLAARIGQTLVHVGIRPTNASASLRFVLFFIQLVCMITMGTVIVAAMRDTQPRIRGEVSGRFRGTGDAAAPRLTCCLKPSTKRETTIG